MYTERKDTFEFKSVILRFLFVALFIFILIWLFPLKSDLKNAMKDASNNNVSEDLSVFYDRIFNENVIAMKDSAKSYFTTPRLPQNVGDKVKMTLGEMLDKKIILPFKDKNGKQCDLENSYVEITKYDDEFVMKVNLKCSDQENYLLVYMGCYDYCETTICEKKQADVKTPVVYPVKEEKPVTNVTNNIYNKIVNKITTTNITINNYYNDEEPPKDNDDTPEDETKPNVEYLYEYQKTTNKKGSCSYTDWSAEQTEPITATSTIEVKTRTVSTKTITGYNVTTTNDITKPIYGTVEVGIGYEVKKTCKSYGYVNSGEIAYGNWQYVGYVTLSYVPTNSDSVKYVPVTDTDWLCESQCQAGIDRVYKKYVREPINAVEYKCTSYEDSKVLITANKTVITGYEKKVVSREPIYENKTVKYYSSRTKNCTSGTSNTDTVWSVYNDTTLLNNGYKYTGNKKQK